MDVEGTYGVDETIQILVEISDDDGSTYEALFTGTLDLSTLIEIDSTKVQCAVIRDDLWTKFMNRRGTPVDIQSTTDLDGNPVDPCQAVRL